MIFGKKYADFLLPRTQIVCGLVALSSVIADFGLGYKFDEVDREIWILIILAYLLLFLAIKLMLNTSTIAIKKEDLVILTFFLYSVVNIWLKSNYLPIRYYSIILISASFFSYITIRLLLLNKWITGRSIILTFTLTLLFNLILILLQYIKVVPAENPQFVSGGFFNPGPCAIYLTSLCVFSILAFKYIPRRDVKNRVLFVFNCCMSVVFIMISFSRAAWLGLLVGSLTTFLFVNKKLGNHLRSLATNTVTIFIGIIGVINVGIALFNFKKESAIGRLLTWNLSFEIIKDHPITGVGFGNFSRTYANYQYYYFASDTPGSSSYKAIAGEIYFSFNDFLQIICEEGIIGFTLFFVALLLILNAMRNSGDKYYLLRAACFASIISILVSGIVSYPLKVSVIQWHFWVCSAILVTFSKSNPNFLTLKSSVAKVILIVLLLFTSFFCFSYTIRRSLAFIKLDGYSNITSSSLLSEYHALADHPYYLFLLAKCYMEEKDYRNAIEIYKELLDISPSKEIYYQLGSAYYLIGNLKLAEESFQFVYISQPALLTPKYLLAKLYYSTSQQEKFRKMAHDVIKSKSKIESFETEYMRREIRDLYFNTK